MLNELLPIVLVVPIALAVPLPWWLAFFHVVAQNCSKPLRYIAYFSVGIIWFLCFFIVFHSRQILFAYHILSTVPTPLLYTTGFAVLLLAAYIDLQVMKYLGLKRLICITEVKQERSASQLVTTGIYRYARHPRYVEYMLIALGLGLVFRYSVFFWLALYLLAGFWIATYFEEQELVHRFGNAYTDYQKRVPRFFVRM